MNILAIESSCDEFSIAIINSKGQILTNIISSQIKNHIEFGGVVPELAARLHLQNFPWVIKAALQEASLSLEELTHISYTKTPGLIGSLIVGKIVAETLATYLNLPLLGLHHIEGHIFGASIDQQFVYPVMAMVVSGGHTQIELVTSPNDFIVVGATDDDAIGECYDKVARVLGLEYPGGPKIDHLTRFGNQDRYQLPIPKTEAKFNFSYSGLKTAAINLIHNLEQRNEALNLEDFCASFQKTAIATIEQKLELAILKYQPKTLTIAGGVSANSAIREMILRLGQKHQIINTIIPKLEYCTDNAAMIAKLAFEKLKGSK